jgi:tripartite-type tricarboxylate transporter receptor subunit TctC
MRNMRYMLAVIALVASAGAHAQYPSKAIRFVVPFPPGGPLDIVARSIGQDLNKAWAQPVLIDNRRRGREHRCGSN